VSSTRPERPGVRAGRGPDAALTRRTGWVFVLLLWCLAATSARASTAVLGPGSVTPTLWYRADVGFNNVAGTWTDQSGSGIVASAPSGASAPVSQPVDANYNPGINFNGTSQWLRGQLASSAFSNGSSYIFVVSTASSGSSSNPLSAVLSGYNAGPLRRKGSVIRGAPTASIPARIKVSARFPGAPARRFSATRPIRRPPPQRRNAEPKRHCRIELAVGFGQSDAMVRHRRAHIERRGFQPLRRHHRRGSLL
jgi:hypothetical protein